MWGGVLCAVHESLVPWNAQHQSARLDPFAGNEASEAIALPSLQFCNVEATAGRPLHQVIGLITYACSNSHWLETVTSDLCAVEGFGRHQKGNAQVALDEAVSVLAVREAVPSGMSWC